MKTNHETVTDHAEANPSFYVIAADHLFDCDCLHCVTFLVLTGIDGTEEYEAIKNELYSTTTLRELFNELL